MSFYEAAATASSDKGTAWGFISPHGWIILERKPCHNVTDIYNTRPVKTPQDLYVREEIAKKNPDNPNATEEGNGIKQYKTVYNWYRKSMHDIGFLRRNCTHECFCIAAEKEKEKNDEF